jgi:hypothetical protein
MPTPLLPEFHALGYFAVAHAQLPLHRHCALQLHVAPQLH